MKRVRYVDGALDALDTRILAALADDARTPMRELAQKIGLSAPSTSVLKLASVTSLALLITLSFS